MVVVPSEFLFKRIGVIISNHDVFLRYDAVKKILENPKTSTTRVAAM